MILITHIATIHQNIKYYFSCTMLVENIEMVLTLIMSFQ